ncbi:MAG: BREX-1 system phosphatase PglZ type A, partial [Peptostreptococcaceae bacterium]
TNDFDGVLKALFIEELCESNKYMEAIKKFGDLKVLWILAEKYYGFILEEKSLEGLLIYLIITNLSYTLEEEVPKCFRGYVLDKKEDSFVFINHFMNHSTDSKVYDDLATSIESKLNILEYIKEWDIDNYLKCDTFKAFDVEIISKLVLQLLSDIEDYPRYKNIILQRRRLHWFKNFQDEYEAISTAIELFETKKKLDEV